MESFSQNKIENSHENISEKELLHARNEIQIKLAARFYGFEIEDEQLGKWITEYSEKFGYLILQHPEFLEKYAHGEMDEVMDDVSELLYEKRGIEK